MKVEIRRLPHGQGLDLPFYATSGAAGLDVLAALPAGAKLVLEPGARNIVPTGFALSLPPSSLPRTDAPALWFGAGHSATILNAPGTIDSDYRGEVKAILVNLGPRPFRNFARHAHRAARDCARGAHRARRERGAYGNGRAARAASARRESPGGPLRDAAASRRARRRACGARCGAACARPAGQLERTCGAARPAAAPAREFAAGARARRKLKSARRTLRRL